MTLCARSSNTPTTSIAKDLRKLVYCLLKRTTKRLSRQEGSKNWTKKKCFKSSEWERRRRGRVADSKTGSHKEVSTSREADDEHSVNNQIINILLKILKS